MIHVHIYVIHSSCDFKNFAKKNCNDMELQVSHTQNDAEFKRLNNLKFYILFYLFIKMRKNIFEFNIRPSEELEVYIIEILRLIGTHCFIHI